MLLPTLEISTGSFLISIKIGYIVSGVVVGIITVLLFFWMQGLLQRRKLRKIVNQKLTVTQSGKAKLGAHLNEQSEKAIEKLKGIVLLPIGELLVALKTGRYTAKEVLHAYQLKALEVDKQTNCITEVITEAEQWAEELDKLPIKKPLHGLPISIKDNFFIKGYDCTSGLIHNLNKPVNDDACIVKVLKEAGAVPYVKTNVPQTLLSFNCANPIYGVTQNPYSALRVPGGSSGGEGALLALGGSVVGLGSDIGGSLRIPAHMCGVCCLKPTGFRISGQNLKKSIDGLVGVVNATGFLSRDVDGLVIIMQNLLKDRMFSLDPDVVPLPFSEKTYTSKKPLRIGYYFDDGVITPTPGCQRAVHIAKQILEKNGHELVPFAIPDPWKAYTLAYSLFLADGNKTLSRSWKNEIVENTMSLTQTISSMPTIVRKIFAAIVNRLTPRIGVLVSQTGCSALEVWDNMAQRQAYIKQFYALWQSHRLDAVLAPGFSMPAPPHDATSKTAAACFTTMIYNFLNLPAGTIPITKESDEDQKNLELYPTDDLLFQFMKKATEGANGMPIGVQIVSMPWNEELVLRIMKEVEAMVII